MLKRNTDPRQLIVNSLGQFNIGVGVSEDYSVHDDGQCVSDLIG